MHQNHFWLHEKIDNALASFFDPNSDIIPAIKQWKAQRKHFHLHITGPSYTGKTHLIYGLINEFAGHDALFINQHSQQVINHPEELLTPSILIIDDLTNIIDNMISTEQFIALYNHRLGNRLPLITAGEELEKMNHKADLVSRIKSATLIQTHDRYAPNDLVHLHQLIAKRHGYNLDQSVALKLATFYEKRVSVQLPVLFEFLQYLQATKKNPSVSSFSAFQKALG